MTLAFALVVFVFKDMLLFITAHFGCLSGVKRTCLNGCVNASMKIFFDMSICTKYSSKSARGDYIYIIVGMKELLFISHRP
jgi:hypothetical protein